MTVKKFLLYGILFIILSILGIYAYVHIAVIDELPSFEQLENPPQELATRVLSNDGEVLDMFYIKRRTYIPYDSIPKNIINALISTEDREYFGHWGIHSMRIVKAFIKNILALRAREGASTITQQLARNLFLNREFSLVRKIKEAITAVKLEQTYTKKEIIELYCNTVYFGRGAYGIQVAANAYFNKLPYELNISECAFLIALLKAPENYSSISNYEAAINRRNLVLSMMADNGFVEENEYYQALMQPVYLNQTSFGNKDAGIAPHFVELVRQTLEKDDTYNLKGYNLYRDGLIIHTTLNATMQRHANIAVAEHMKNFQAVFRQNWSWRDKSNLLSLLITQAVKEKPEYIQNKDPQKRAQMIQLAMNNPKFIDSVKRKATTIQTGINIIDPLTGFILAMIGGTTETGTYTEEARYALNHAVQIKRQPGSSFKPFVYASAMINGVTPSTMIESGPFSYTLPSGRIWSPSGSGSGPVPLSTGLKYSINTVAARLITEYTSPSEVIALAHRMGIKSKLDPYPTLALGAEEITPLEITSAFGTFLNQGISIDPIIITKIEDRRGNILYERKKQLQLTDALQPSIAKAMVKMMRGVVQGGTAASVKEFYPFEAAGKTGTTNDYADAWFIGLTPQLAAGVWVGFDDRRIKFTGWYAQGGKAAAPIWGRMMGKIYRDPTIGYRQTSFGFEPSEQDSLDLLSPGHVPIENRIPELPKNNEEPIHE
ncbi:penicillin-binding protein [Chlorobiota bacterium]|nr:penicillin-binding protein [Chlorobiota bacterium]